MTSNKHSKILQQKAMDMEVIKIVRNEKRKIKKRKKLSAFFSPSQLLIKQFKYN
jgi:hypothetical protein